ncbi:hypothetical protein KP509_13G049200 [Ceratopteris richardii]|nr:hypothetical protein KP509_13G049200 [Ceratopteris richardii]
MRTCFIEISYQVRTNTVSLKYADKRHPCWPFQTGCPTSGFLNLQKRRIVAFSCSCQRPGGEAEKHKQPLRLRTDDVFPGNNELHAQRLERSNANVHNSFVSAIGPNGGRDEQTVAGLHNDDVHAGNGLPTSAYVHLPFCKRRCFYCDFAIVAIGQRNDANSTNIDSTMGSYVTTLCKEITSTLSQLPQASPLKTLFFGGGTPSLLPPQYLSRIVDTLDQHCGFQCDAEISMEMDPGTFDKQTLKQFLGLGVNRVSLGVQSFNEDFLKACGRSHGLQDVYEALDIITGLNVSNWSLDLISSLPHQTLEHWEECLREAIGLSPAHVSVYDLQIEEGTKFGVWYKPGHHPLPDEDKSASFYRLASSLLREAGYEHYEISNYAKPGFQCRHNMVYWKNQPYYGFGLGATSYFNGKRFSRPRKLKGYADFVELCINQSSDNFSANEEYLSFYSNTVESVEDRVCDTIMLSLRLASGLNLNELSKNFGHELRVHICKSFLPFINSGHAVAVDSKFKTVPPDTFSTALSEQSASKVLKDVIFIRLTDPDGFLLSNEIISSLFTDLPIK